MLEARKMISKTTIISDSRIIDEMERRINDQPTVI